MPPYQKDFFQVSLILQSGNAKADIDNQSDSNLENTLYFLSPEHIFSWQRTLTTRGFIVYFKSEFFNFFNGNFIHEFSFFNLSSKNFLKLDAINAGLLAEEFEKIYKEYYTPNTYRIEILQSVLLSLLFKCKFIQEQNSEQDSIISKKQNLIFEFENLVANWYISHKQVTEYAQRLNVSTNTLNRVIRESTGKTAKDLISAKIIREAKKKLKYTTEDISEVAYSLGFEEPTHFIRFFKNHTNSTPKEYRKIRL